jgi:hypothetical protein
VAIVNIASFSIHGPDLEAFIHECIGYYTDEACRLLRPASADDASRKRVAHIVDFYATTALTSIRMISHVNDALANGNAWEDVMRMLPDQSAPGNDVRDDENCSSDTAAAPENSPDALAASRQAVIMPILKRKRWTRGRWASEAAVGKNSIYDYLKGERNPGPENRQAMADALGLKVHELPE